MAISSALSGIAVIVYINDVWPEALVGTSEFHGLEIVLISDAVLFLLSWFAVGAWIYRAHANLLLTDTPPIEFTPGWAIGWFAVPIANLFKPFQAMKALWRVSHAQDPNANETAPGLLWAWWLAWILSSLGSFANEYSSLDLIYYGLTSASAALLAVVIHQITKAQPSMSIASTFD